MQKAEDRHFRKLRRIIRGAITDTLKAHPDFVAPKAAGTLKNSLTKRIAGQIVSGFASGGGRKGQST